MKQEDKKLKRRIRRSYFESTISIAMVLFLLGIAAYGFCKIYQDTNKWRESLEINIMLNNAPQEAYDSLSTILRNTTEIKEAQFIDKNSAAEEYKKDFGEDFEAFLGSNPLPNSFRIKLKAESSQPSKADSLAKIWTEWDEVMEIVYPQSTLQTVNNNISLISILLLMISSSLLVIIIILLRNTIRMTINTRLQLIDTMRLVGATRWFIMRPFLGRSIINGLLAGLLASLMLVGMTAAIKYLKAELVFLLDDTVLMLVCAGITIFGIILALIFTATAVNRAIRLRGGELYL